MHVLTLFHLLQAFSGSALSALVKGLPDALQRQYEYEDPIVRGGKHLLHSPFFKVRQNVIIVVKFICHYRKLGVSFCRIKEMFIVGQLAALV